MSIFILIVGKPPLRRVFRAGRGGITAGCVGAFARVMVPDRVRVVGGGVGFLVVNHGAADAEDPASSDRDGLSDG